MPVITAYIGTSNLCILLYKNKSDYEFFYSPYIYLPNLFSNYTTEEEFYTTIIKLFCKKSGVDFAKCDIYISGFVAVPEFKDPKFKRVSFVKLFDNMPNIYPVLVNDFAFATKFFMVASTSFGFLKNVTDDSTFSVNKSVYPNLRPLDLSSQLNLDKEVLDAVSKDKSIKWDPNTPVVFMGSRFYAEEERDLDYLYMFSLIHTPGIYDIYLDRTHTLLLFNMLNTVTEKEKLSLDLENIEHVGTLVTGKGSVECLISSDEGTPQVIDIDKNTMKRHPLDELTEYRLVIKNHSIGTMERTVFGGKLGIVVDTRDDKVESFKNIRKTDSYLRILKN